MGQWVMFSDFGDSYHIYRACELVVQVEPGEVHVNRSFFLHFETDGVTTAVGALQITIQQSFIGHDNQIATWSIVSH